MFSHTNYYSQHTQRKVVLERDTKITPALYKHIKTCVQEQREKNSWYTHVQATNSCINYCYTLKSDINTHTHTIIKYTITIYTGVAMIDTHYCYNSSCTWGASHNWAPREVRVMIVTVQWTRSATHVQYTTHSLSLSSGCPL